MMSSSACIEQKGVVENISDGFATVSIMSFSACANCHSKKLCGIDENSQKSVTALTGSKTFSVGENVGIIMKRSLGLKATFIAYILPFILMLAVMLTLNYTGVKEIITGLISILVLVPYYSVIYLFNDRLKKTFTFELTKLE
ncbi:MAG: SoxR reducing system RseC family protein [Bacteroidales bacterium]|nr:SoxR reducing system RseC family protein [Bacteroidales bacterium]